MHTPSFRRAARPILASALLFTLALSATSARADDPPAAGAPAAGAPAADAPAADALTMDAPPAAAPDPATAAPSDAPAGWEGAVYAHARPAVLRVRSVYGDGGGFLFSDGHHVATAFHLIESGRDIAVRAAPGDDWIDARVVAVDPDADLAILRVDVDLGAPLELAAPPAVGEPVVGLGHPLGSVADDDEVFEGLLTWSLTRGMVSAVGGQSLQIDAALASGSSGAPVLDRRGRVVGVASRRDGGVGVATRADALPALLEEVGTEAPYRGRWRPILELEAQIAVEGGQSFGGVSMGLGAVGWERFGIVGRFGVLAHTDDVSDEPLYARRIARLTFGLEAQFRHPFRAGDVPIQLVIGAGLAGARESVREETLEIAFPGGCDPRNGPCAADTRMSAVEDRRWLFRPTLRVALLIGGFASLSYQVQLDVMSPGDSAHVIGIGLSW